MNDILYSPWRLQYILSEKDTKCIFCIEKIEKKKEEHFVVHCNEHTFVILNIFPYNNGHLMIVPKSHKSSLEELTKAEMSSLFETVRLTERIVKKVYNPEGINIGINLGKAAGAGVEEHLHVHLVPRWIGDSNFMTTVGSTRVIPESFEETFNKISKAFKLEIDK